VGDRRVTILFDLDGTLIDSTEAILESFHRSYDIYGLKQEDDEAIKALIGHPLDVMYRKLGVDEKIVWDIVATYKEHYREISKLKTELLPLAVEAIALASKHANLGIVTTKTGKYSQELLEHFGLMQHFEVLIGREHVTHPKPHAEPIAMAISKMQANTQQTWMIGDTRLDIESAHNAGVKSIGVLSGYDTHEQLATMSPLIEEHALSAVERIIEINTRMNQCIL
jgi:phosphoglycolate phosphatase